MATDAEIASLEAPFVVCERDDPELLFFAALDDILDDRFDCLWGRGGHDAWDARGMHFTLRPVVEGGRLKQRRRAPASSPRQVVRLAAVPVAAGSRPPRAARGFCRADHAGESELPSFASRDPQRPPPAPVRRMTAVANVQFLARSPADERQMVTMAVGVPKPTPIDDADPPPHAYAATVTLTPFREAHPVFGESAFQALTLGLSYLRSVLELYAREGWRFYLEEDDAEPFDPVTFYLDTVPSFPEGFRG